MTGSGTLLDPYVIWNLADLQAVRTYDAAYFELGADIDATATAAWYGGAGFEPLDWPYPQKRRPTGDFAQVGAWTVFPAAPPTFFDKVDELDQDGDVTYIRVNAAGGTILFTAPAFNIPAGATAIALRMEVISRVEVAGDCDAKIYIRVNGVNYETPFWREICDGTSYEWHDFQNDDFDINPNTGLPWTVDDINGVGPNPLQAWGIKIAPGKECRITKLTALVTCHAPTNITFDGKGHTIDGLTINRGVGAVYPCDIADVALFRWLDGGAIRNIKLTNCSITGRWTTAGLVSGIYWNSGGISGCTVTGTLHSDMGEVGGIAGFMGYPGSNVDDCHFNGTITCGRGILGGIAGSAWRIAGGPYTISNCTANVTITAGVGAHDIVGGIVGDAWQYSLISCTAEGTVTGGERIGGLAGDFYDGGMSDCVANVTVESPFGGRYVGGLVGYLNGGWGGPPFTYSLLRCRAAGNVSSAGGDYSGGLVGYCVGVFVRQSFATGNVSGDDRVGGIVGYSEARISDTYAMGNVTGDDRVGGLVGNHGGETITNSFSVGVVVGNTNVGGLVGLNGGTVTNSFWDTQTSGQTTSDGGTGKTTAEMKTLATFLDAGWDIEAKTTDKNTGYPYLAWQSTWYIFVATVPPPAPLSVMTLPATEIR